MGTTRVQLRQGSHSAGEVLHQVRDQLARPSPADLRTHGRDRPHGRQDVLAWAALLIGSASFLLAAVGGSILGAGLGALGFVVAAVAQMVSATTTERWLIIPGWVMATIGGLLNLFFMA